MAKAVIVHHVVVDVTTDPPEGSLAIELDDNPEQIGPGWVYDGTWFKQAPAGLLMSLSWLLRDKGVLSEQEWSELLDL